MPNVNLDTRRDSIQVEQAPLVGQNFGMAPLNARQQQLGVLQQISAQTADMATNYAVKNKQADMVADALAYESHAQQLTDQANNAAQQTSDPNEIKRIYHEAQESLEKWVNGKTDGAPNVRWEDQIPQIRGDAEKRRVHFSRLAIQQQTEIARKQTNAKGENSILQGVRTNNADLIRDGVGAMVLNGTLTPEEGNLRVKQETIRAEQFDASQRIKAIGDLPAEQASFYARDYRKDLADGLYKELTKEEQEQLQLDIDAAVETAQRKDEYKTRQQEAETERQQRARAKSSADALTRFRVENAGRWPTINEMQALDLTQEHQLRVLEANSKPQDRNAKMLAANELMKLIGTYDRNKDPDSLDAVQVEATLLMLDPDLRKPIEQLWDLKTTPGKETQALGAQRILETLGNLETGDKNIKGEKPFRWLEEDQRQYLLSTTLDRFTRWVEETPRSDAEIINWIYADPYINGIRVADNAAAAKKAYSRPAVRAPVTMPTMTPTQSVYLDDETFSSLEGFE